MKHRFGTLARVALALAWMAFSLPACRAGSLPTPPDGAGEPVRIRSTRTPTRTTTAPGKNPTQTLLPTAPLPQIEPPLRWYLRGTPPEDLPRVNEQLNRELSERGFQARVEIDVIDRAAFDRQLAEIQAAEQPWDMVALSAASYPAWLETGSLLPLTAYPNPATGKVENLIETQLPGLQTSLPKQAWAGLLQAGGFSAIPNQGAWVQPRGVSIRADVVRALNLQADLERVQTYADLSPLLAKIQAAVADGSLKTVGITDGDKIRRAAGLADLLQPENAGYDVLWGPFVVRVADARAGMLNWYQTDAFHELAGLRRSWQQAGYLPAETLTPDQVRDGYQAGQYVVQVGRPVWPGSGLQPAQRYGYAWIDKALTPAFLSTRTVMSSLTGVNAHIAGDPERVRRVMLFLEWLRKDAEIYNLLAYGLEGQHWQWSDREKQVITLTPGSRYQPDFLEQLGNRTLSYSADRQSAGMWQAVGQANTRAPASPVLGFRFDTRPVAAESAAVQGIMLELEDPLANGQVEDIAKAVRKLQKALQEAGLEAVQTELDAQLSAWKK